MTTDSKTDIIGEDTKKNLFTENTHINLVDYPALPGFMRDALCILLGEAESKKRRYIQIVRNGEIVRIINSISVERMSLEMEALQDTLLMVYNYGVEDGKKSMVEVDIDVTSAVGFCTICGSSVNKRRTAMRLDKDAVNTVYEYRWYCSDQFCVHGIYNERQTYHPEDCIPAWVTRTPDVSKSEILTLVAK